MTQRAAIGDSGTTPNENDQQTHFPSSPNAPPLFGARHDGGLEQDGLCLLSGRGPGVQEHDAPDSVLVRANFRGSMWVCLCVRGPQK